MRSAPAWVLLATICAAQAPAATQRLDDSRSPQPLHGFDLRWATRGAQLMRGDGALFVQRGDIRSVEIRLDTSRQRGQRARVFLTLPAQLAGLAGSSGFRLSWDTRGTLAAGSVTPGNRALVFDGLIGSDLLVEFFDFVVEVESSQLRGTLRFEPIFEIETP